MRLFERNAAFFEQKSSDTLVTEQIYEVYFRRLLGILGDAWNRRDLKFWKVKKSTQNHKPHMANGGIWFLNFYVEIVCQILDSKISFQ